MKLRDIDYWLLFEFVEMTADYAIFEVDGIRYKWEFSYSEMLEEYPEVAEMREGETLKYLIEMIHGNPKKLIESENLKS